MCWHGKMHLETLEVSLRYFDEELCLGFSRVCEDWILSYQRLNIVKKNKCD